MKLKSLFPGVVEKSAAEIAEAINTIKQSELSEALKLFIIKCIEIAMWIPMALEAKNISIHRLKTIIFGKGYKAKKIRNSNTKNNEDNKANQFSDIPEAANSETPTKDSDPIKTDLPSNSVAAKPGHGRMPSSIYKDCQEIVLKLFNLTAGDACPSLCGGTLSQYRPGDFVRIKGQNFVEVVRYTVEKLRCNLCGVLYVPEIPIEVGTEKYDASFKAILAMQKYYLAVPFYRQENFQRMLGFPLSDATQWDLIEKLAGFCYPIFSILKVLAANGTLIHNDDTKLLILEVIKAIKAGTAGKRTGTYTTGIIAENNGHKIALFLNGRQHSGENVSDLLKLRDPAKGPIMQMCDALSANVSHKLQVILCNCLSHGFRKFDELVGYFETECIIIMEKLSKVYDFDDLTRGMNDADRLAYHQTHSKPVMDEVKTYMDLLLEERRVEPNNQLGQAIKYMQNHWHKLTRFLTVPGAPLDNNIVERALKIAIRNRKSSMFYKTIYSANIGGMLTSIIYTCDLAGKNPHHYLIALQRHTEAVFAAPEKWLPWNYQETMAASATNVANHPVHSQPLDYPVAA